MSHPDYAITYQPLFTTLQAIDVQALIDQAGDPLYNQTLIQIGDVLVRQASWRANSTGTNTTSKMSSSSSWTGYSASNSTAPTPLSSGRGRRSPSQPECSTGLSSRHAVSYP